MQILRRSAPQDDWPAPRAAPFRASLGAQQIRLPLPDDALHRVRIGELAAEAALDEARQLGVRREAEPDELSRVIYEELDPTTDGIGKFAEAASRASGEALGKSSGPRPSSRSTRRQ